MAEDGVGERAPDPAYDEGHYRGNRDFYLLPDNFSKADAHVGILRKMNRGMMIETAARSTRIKNSITFPALSEPYPERLQFEGKVDPKDGDKPNDAHQGTLASGLAVEKHCWSTTRLAH